MTDDVPRPSAPEIDWTGRRVLVTGHTGFKGSWLALWLAKRGAEVHGVALDPPSEPGLYEEARVEDVMASTARTDVRHLDAFTADVARVEPEVVFHLAAQSLVRAGYRDPVATYSTNVMGTVHLLEAVRRVGSARAVVVVTSDKCYENREWVWPYREDEPMGGKDPYSNSKGCAELVTDAFRRSYFAGPGAARVASARAGNVLGGGDWAEDRLLPDLVRAALSGDVVRIRSPHAIRPWQHVLEPLSGYLTLAEHLLSGDGAAHARGWNFGPDDDDARSVGWIVERMAERWGEGFRWEADPGPHPPEALTLKLDSSLARHHLGWRPRLDLGRALDWLVEWTRAHRDGADLRRITEAQIDRYAKLA